MSEKGSGNGQKIETKELGCVLRRTRMCELSPSSLALPTCTACVRVSVCVCVCVCVCLAGLPEKGVSACLPLKRREGSVHGYSSLLSLLFLFRSHSLTGSLRIRPLSLGLLSVLLCFKFSVCFKQICVFLCFFFFVFFYTFSVREEVFSRKLLEQR